MPLTSQEISSIASWYPAPPFFDPGVQTTLDEDDVQQLLWIYRSLHIIPPAFTGIIYAPLITFVAPPRPMAVMATLDVLSFVAPMRPMAVTSPVRALSFVAPARPMAVTATLDVLTYIAPFRPMAVTSRARGGG